MTPSKKPLNITVDVTQPELLTGLEQWLQLGLITEEQVREISETYLICSVPERVTSTTTLTPEKLSEISPTLTPNLIFSTATAPFKQVGRLTGEIGQAFKEELSVRWLLFLGVFLVVTSSGLLAAKSGKLSH